MDRITRIFNKHINEEILVPKKNNNPLLSGVLYFDPLVLSSKLSYIWNDIFPLYGWTKYNRSMFINRNDKVIIEVHNTWNTFNSHDKTQRLELLRDSKRENFDYEIVFGAIVDKQPKDTYTSGNVRVITGDYFLLYMLGEEFNKIQQHLRKLMVQFYNTKLRAFINTLCKDEIAS